MKNGPRYWEKFILRLLFSTLAALLMASLTCIVLLRLFIQDPDPGLLEDLAVGTLLYTPNLIIPYVLIIALYDLWLNPKATRWPLRWLYLFAALTCFLVAMFGLDILFFNPLAHASEIWDLFMSQYFSWILASLPSFLAFPIVHEKIAQRVDKRVDIG